MGSVPPEKHHFYFLYLSFDVVCFLLCRTPVGVQQPHPPHSILDAVLYALYPKISLSLFGFFLNVSHSYLERGSLCHFVTIIKILILNDTYRKVCVGCNHVAHTSPYFWEISGQILIAHSISQCLNSMNCFVSSPHCSEKPPMLQKKTVYSVFDSQKHGLPVSLFFAMV